MRRLGSNLPRPRRAALARIRRTTGDSRRVGLVGVAVATLVAGLHHGAGDANAVGVTLGGPDTIVLEQHLRRTPFGGGLRDVETPDVRVPLTLRAEPGDCPGDPAAGPGSVDFRVQHESHAGGPANGRLYGLLEGETSSPPFLIQPLVSAASASAVFSGDRVAGIDSVTVSWKCGPEGPEAYRPLATKRIRIVVRGAGGGGATIPRPKRPPTRPRADERRVSYVVELKAWIPQHAVVDPVRPEPLAGPQALECTPPEGLPRSFFVASTFRGDGHRPYPGTSRLLGTQRLLVFVDTRSKRVTRVLPQGFTRSVGATHRDVQVRDLDTGTITTCTQSATADPARSVQGAFTGARAWFTQLRGANPLVVGAPSIDARIDGLVRPDGGLRIRYRADQMPSIGIRVLRDGRLAALNVVNDVSCRDLRGPIGAVEVASRLITVSRGRFVVPIRGGFVDQARCTEGIRVVGRAR